MMIVLSLACLGLLGFGACTPIDQVPSRQVAALPQDTALSRQKYSLPLLDLDYATYKAAVYNEEKDVYTFTNIRYAAPPTGKLRWKKPAPPEKLNGIQDGSYGPACSQKSDNGGTLGSEDCLFLDVYVPGAAARAPSNHKLPVAVFVHGGGNNNGAKDQTPYFLYNGTGPIETSKNGLILVTINYRLGAFGWLAGDTSEKHGLPNAGLHDQRAAFKWVKKYISRLGGDPSQISAWGESAGASNVFHHLIAQGGTLDPIFSKVFVQSPASLDNVDRLGFTEDCFQAFARFAGCSDYNCLRSLNSTTLASASNTWISHRSTCGGIAADGTFIRQAGNVEFAAGNYWKGIESLIVSHCSNEPELFLPRRKITTDGHFKRYIARRYPSYAVSSGILDALLAYYPSPSLKDSPYKTQTDRVAAWTLDFIFADRIRSLVKSYFGKVWAAKYSVPSNKHGSTVHSADLVPLFWNQYMTSRNLSRIPSSGFLVPQNIVELSATYQSYVVSHAMTGNPNKLSIKGLLHYVGIEWPLVGDLTPGGKMKNVLSFAPQGSEVIIDPDIINGQAEFVTNVTIALTNVGGYAVPGTFLHSPIASCETNATNTNDINPRGKQRKCASRNYVDQCEECRES